MPIHTVDVRVEKQEEHEACWASICMAVVAAIKPGSAGKAPTDLYRQWNAATGRKAQDPGKVLESEFGIRSADVGYKSSVSTAGDSSLRATDIADKVTTALAAGIPVICGLTTYDDAPLGAVQGKPIPWRHAVLIYKCDTTRRVCWIRDPAPGGGKAAMADRLVTFDELASGFVYMNKKDFGPKTLALLGISDGVLTARAFKLIVPAK